MNKSFLIIVLVAVVIIPLAFFGCKAKVEKQQMIETSATMPAEAMPPATEALTAPEPSQVIATETIPPSAAPQMDEKAAVAQLANQEKDSRVKDIQTALKNAGFYAGSIDGKLGPKTKKAIEEFQKSKALKMDGKVGPKTWAELEKYLVQQ
jgi:murein L,D-transpeptidase YcbB/YkuD